MSTCKKLLPIGALALAFTFAPAEAAPTAPATAIAGKSDASAVTQVQWGWGYRRYGYGRGWGPGPWLGLGAGVVIGSIIANEAYRPRRGYYYDDYAYNGPYYYPVGLLRRSARDLCPELPLVRVEYGPLYDLWRARDGSAPT